MQALTMLVVNLFAVVCAVSAAVLCLRQREGWGWFLFIASCSAVSPTFLTHIGSMSQ